MDNRISNNQLIQQLQNMQKLASAGAAKNDAPPEAGFDGVLKSVFDQVNATQKQAAAMSKAFETGDENVALVDVMIQMQKARISFEAMVQVRNRLLSAYQDIMNMQV